ncbi:transcriptional regulator [Rhizocola hellebori]|uniref:Transcriptional regulator n=1 Tax=Rhizocola hellebori TaxID=1392758 RepID=A0A8J3Q8J6_9ACTN|nr:LCP family protein [Rhizocola hellebori]GIH05060.1 transcriptional regulator [Rhizocola hellebori]
MSDPEPSALPIKLVAPDGKKQPRFRHLLYVVSILTGIMLLLCGGIAGGLWLYAGSIEDKIDRVDAFTGIPDAARPSKITPQAMNILLLGSDSRANRVEQDSGDTGARSDTIIVVHLPADRQRAQLISIPRDTWTTIPGHGKAKINAGYALGGTPLTVRTVEEFTKVRIDHVILIDFAGFKEVIDAIGGIEIVVEQTFKSIHKPYRTFQAGAQHLNGEEALDYSRQRYQFKDGDFHRIENQQQVMKAVMEKAASRDLLTDAAKLNAFVRATADSLTADHELSVFDLALELRHLRSADLTFLTSPSKGTGMEGSQSVVYTDPQQAGELYAAVNSDRVGAWLSANPQFAN